MVVDSKKKTIHLVRSDGNVRILHKTVLAGQIMKEFPGHLLCHSGSFYIGQKTLALSQHDQLMVGNKYFLLPEQFFQSELTLVSIASCISSSSPPNPIAGVSAGPLRSIERASALCQPFEMQSSDVGRGRGIRVSAEFITKIMEDRRLNIDERERALSRDSADDERGLCNTPELKKQYEQLVTSRGQCWRPKLETIREKEKNPNFFGSCF